MSQFKIEGDFYLGLSIGIQRVTLSLVGVDADAVMGEWATLLSHEHLQPVLEGDTPVTPSRVEVNGTKPAPSEEPANLRFRVISGLKMMQGKSAAGKDYHYWTPLYDDPQGGIKTIGRIFVNGAIADQLRNLVPEQHRPNKLNVYTPIPPEFQFKMFYTLKETDGKKLSEVQYLEPVKAAAETGDYPYDDSIPF